jgi:hypothetical protein
LAQLQGIRHGAGISGGGIRFDGVIRRRRQQQRKPTVQAQPFGAAGKRRQYHGNQRHDLRRCRSGSFLVPTSSPQVGSYSNGLVTLNNDVNAGSVTTYITVQGVPCSVTAVTTDGAGYNWQVAYKNLNSGFVATFTASYPGGSPSSHARQVRRFSTNVCSGLILGGVIVGTFGLALGFALLPEAAAIGGAYAALGGVVNVSNVVGWGMGILSAAGC